MADTLTRTGAAILRTPGEWQLDTSRRFLTAVDAHGEARFIATLWNPGSETRHRDDRPERLVADGALMRAAPAMNDLLVTLTDRQVSNEDFCEALAAARILLGELHAN